MNEETLIAELQKWKGDQNRSLKSIFEKVEPGMFSKPQQSGDNPVNPFKAIMQALTQSSQVIEQSMLGVSPEQAQFNSYCGPEGVHPNSQRFSCEGVLFNDYTS